MTNTITFECWPVDENTPDVTDCENVLMFWPEFGWNEAYYDDHYECFTTECFDKKRAWFEHNKPTHWALTRNIPAPGGEG